MNSTKKATKSTVSKKVKNQQKTTNNISTSKKVFGTKSNSIYNYNIFLNYS
jgi:hypothetical protein